MRNINFSNNASIIKYILTSLSVSYVRLKIIDLSLCELYKSEVYIYIYINFKFILTDYYFNDKVFGEGQLIVGA